jgi:hypothetical protein
MSTRSGGVGACPSVGEQRTLSVSVDTLPVAVGLNDDDEHVSVSVLIEDGAMN